MEKEWSMGSIGNIMGHGNVLGYGNLLEAEVRRDEGGLDGKTL